MSWSLRTGALALVLLGTAALVSPPASANDFGEEGDFGGSYRYIGPGAAYAPPAYVGVAPIYPVPVYAPPVYDAPEYYVEPEVEPPVLDEEDYEDYDDEPDAGVIFITPEGDIAVGGE